MSCRRDTTGRNRPTNQPTKAQRHNNIAVRLPASKAVLTVHFDFNLPAQANIYARLDCNEVQRKQTHDWLVIIVHILRREGSGQRDKIDRYRTEGRIERLRLSAPMDLKSILSTSQDHPYLIKSWHDMSSWYYRYILPTNHNAKYSLRRIVAI